MLLAGWGRQLMGSKAVLASPLKCRPQPQRWRPTAVSCHGLSRCNSCHRLSLADACAGHYSSSSSSTCDPRLAAALQPTKLRWGTVTAAVAVGRSADSSGSSGGSSKLISSPSSATGGSRPGRNTTGSDSSKPGVNDKSGSSASRGGNRPDSHTPHDSSRGRGRARGRGGELGSSRQSSQSRSSTTGAGGGSDADAGGCSNSRSTKRPRTGTSQPGTHPGKSTGPAWITQQITKQCSTLQQLQQLVDQHGHGMNAINIAAAISRLPKLYSTTASREQRQQQPDRQQLLDQLWLLLHPKLLVECEQRELANIIAASSKQNSANQQLYEACVQQFLGSIDAASPRQLSNVVYALCTAPTAIMQQYQAGVQKQLMLAFMNEASNANAQDISNVLYGMASSGQQLEAVQVQQLVKVFAGILHTTKPQEVTNALWAVGKMGQQVPEDQLMQLLTALIGMLHQANPQGVSNTLWAVATMGRQVTEGQLQQLLTAFVGMLHQAKPQEVSNTLWAVATMGRQVPEGQLHQLLNRFSSMLDQATPQNIANTLWACAKLGWLPQQLLAAPQLLTTLPLATAQQLSNVAWACGELGHADEQLMGTLLEEAGQRLAGDGSRHAFIAHGVCNICWSVAVLNLQQYVPKLLPLVQACSQQLWHDVAAEGLWQLQQVHTWLLDFGLAGGNGLQGSLTAEQLQQCRTSWNAQTAATAQAAGANTYQRVVFAALRQLPIAWQQPPQLEQVSLGSDGLPDGALLVDIVGRTASGQLVAVEADGPTHFRRPDGGWMGTTLYRNRALEVRGYIVVTVPYSDWDKLWGSQERRRQYLQQRLVEVGVV